MIRWREERRRWFNAVAVVVVALMVGSFVEVAARLVLVAAVANAAAGVTFVAVIAVFVFRAAGRRRPPRLPYVAGTEGDDDWMEEEPPFGVEPFEIDDDRSDP